MPCWASSRSDSSGGCSSLFTSRSKRGGDLGLGFGIDGAELVEQPGQLVGLHFLGPRLEPLDRRRGGPVVQVGHEPARFFLDDPLGPRPFLLALAAVFLAGGFQIVDRIQIHAGQLADRRIEIARESPGRESSSGR